MIIIDNLMYIESKNPNFIINKDFIEFGSPVEHIYVKISKINKIVTYEGYDEGLKAHVVCLSVFFKDKSNNQVGLYAKKEELPKIYEFIEELKKYVTVKDGGKIE
ncbi:hypothetical protein [Oceanotoga phage vB_OteS-UFV02]